MIIHFGTQGLCKLGKVSDNGDIIEVRYVEFDLDKLTEAEFIDAYKQIIEAKTSWQAEYGSD